MDMGRDRPERPEVTMGDWRSGPRDQPTSESRDRGGFRENRDRDNRDRDGREGKKKNYIFFFNTTIPAPHNGFNLNCSGV